MLSCAERAVRMEAEMKEEENKKKEAANVGDKRYKAVHDRRRIWNGRCHSPCSVKYPLLMGFLPQGGECETEG
jgi:hypothetical protein